MSSAAVRAPMQTIVQNPHDHWITLMYRGNAEGLADLVTRLKEFFSKAPPKRTFTDLGELPHMGAFFGALIPQHQPLRGTDYCFVASMAGTSSVAVAANHLFHDAGSIGMILRGVPETAADEALRGCISKRSVPTPAGPPVGAPLCLCRVDKEQLDRARVSLGLKSRNEVLFAVSACMISAAASPGEAFLQVLHNVRKQRGAQGPGGDFTALTKPVAVPRAGEPAALLLPDAAALTSEYFGKIRAADPEVVVAAEDELVVGHDGPVWMFDTWIGADIAAPSAIPGIELDETLLHSFAAVCKDTVIACDRRDGGALIAFYGLASNFDATVVVDALLR